MLVRMEKCIVTKDLLSSLAIKSYKLGVFIGQNRACPHEINDEVSTSLLTAYNEAFDACTDPKDHRLKFLSLLFDSMADDAVEMSDEELVKLLGEEGIKESADRMRQLFDKVSRGHSSIG